MKANELMIRDWVRSTVSGKAYQVLEIGDPFVLVDNPGGEWLRTIGMKYRIVEPIPLTAEILEKNGFRFYKAVGEIHPYYYLPHRYSMKCTTNGDLHFYLDCIGADIRIYYVHELQHALRLCGLNDLADNFKI